MEMIAWLVLREVPVILNRLVEHTLRGLSQLPQSPTRSWYVHRGYDGFCLAQPHPAEQIDLRLKQDSRGGVLLHFASMSPAQI